MMAALPVSRNVLNGERMSGTRAELEATYLQFIRSEECPAKIQLLQSLQDLAEAWLSAQPHQKRFWINILPRCISRSMLDFQGNTESLSNVGYGFLTISRYATNLIQQPWRKEFKQIKLYGGYYQGEVASIVADANDLMRVIGYEVDEENHCLNYRGANKERLPLISLDLFLASVECRVICRIWMAALESDVVSLNSVISYREQHIGSWEDTLRGLLYEARAQNFALSQKAMTLSSTMAEPSTGAATTSAPMNDNSLYKLYDPNSHSYYSVQRPVQDVWSSSPIRTEDARPDDNPQNDFIPETPSVPMQYYQGVFNNEPEYNECYLLSGCDMMHPQYNMFPNYYLPPKPAVNQQSFVYASPVVQPHSTYTLPAPNANQYDQNTMLMDSSATHQSRYRPIPTKQEPISSSSPHTSTSYQVDLPADLTQYDQNSGQMNSSATHQSRYGPIPIKQGTISSSHASTSYQVELPADLTQYDQNTGPMNSSATHQSRYGPIPIKQGTICSSPPHTSTSYQVKLPAPNLNQYDQNMMNSSTTHQSSYGLMPVKYDSVSSSPHTSTSYQVKLPAEVNQYDQNTGQMNSSATRQSHYGPIPMKKEPIFSSPYASPTNQVDQNPVLAKSSATTRRSRYGPPLTKVESTLPPPTNQYDGNELSAKSTPRRSRYGTHLQKSEPPSPSHGSRQKAQEKCKHPNSVDESGSITTNLDPLPLKPITQTNEFEIGHDMSTEPSSQELKQSPPSTDEADSHSWEYVFENLKIQGYNKDLGERGDLLKPTTNSKRSHRHKKEIVEDLRDVPNEPTEAADPDETQYTKIYHCFPYQEVEGGPLIDDGIMYTQYVPTKKPKNTFENESPVRNKNLYTGGNRPDLQQSPTNRHTEKKGEKWPCHACTYLNDESKTVCKMCGKSKEPGPEVRSPQAGAQCPQCTLVNPVGRDYCDACGACLRPTYI